MTSFNWKILDIQADDGLITQAHYHVTATDMDIEVTTEGNWYFIEPKVNIPFADVTEELVCQWVENESNNSIKARLQEQIDLLNKCKPVVAPWLPQVFTPKIG